MKKLAVIIALVLSTTALMASEREFRINKGSVAENGYAIAWGVPGKKVDFEALDKSSEEEISKFLESSTIVNYLVDLETNKILSTLDSEEAEYSIAGQRYGNHFHIGLEKLEIDGIGYDLDAVAIIENWKWSNSITDLIIINKENNDVNISLDMKDNKFNSLVMNAVSKGLKKPAEIDMLANGAVSINDLHNEYLENIGSVVKLSISSEIPKGEEPVLEVEATIQVTMVNGAPSVKLISISSKME
ncbi:MAG: hypothetical protein H7177_02905 [Rhizobacter sp.]|nr:hypothetical protein [Bacteriovorax sp.]